MSDHTVSGTWAAGDEGHQFTARAVTKTGRVVARVTAHVAVSEYCNLTDIYGKDGLEDVEKTISDACERLAKDAP